MHITLKLYASLSDYLPAEARKTNELPLQVNAGTTVEQIVAPLNMPTRLVHLVLVNGVYVEPAKRLTHELKEGDVLAIWPPIAGG